jgi:hypothetical protein
LTENKFTVPDSLNGRLGQDLALPFLQYRTANKEPVKSECRISNIEPQECRKRSDNRFVVSVEPAPPGQTETFIIRNSLLDIRYSLSTAAI